MATTTPNYGWPVPTSTDLVKDGATAIESLGDLPGLTLGFKTVLLVAEREIQRHANAGDRGAGLRGGGVAQFPTDQQRDLGLVMHAAAVRRHPHGRRKINHAGRRLDEQQRLLGHRVAQLGRVNARFRLTPAGVEVAQVSAPITS